MTCQDRDPDLLLYGLGELSFPRRWQTAFHLQTCVRCRARQAELASVSAQISAALRPPNSGGGPGGAKPIPLSAPVVWSWLLPLVLVVALGVLTFSVARVWYIRSHPAAHAAAKDEGCRPDLPNDQCR